MNDSNDTSVQVFWWIQKIILQIKIHSTSLHRKWMILIRVLFNYSDEFKNLSYKSRFIAHHYIGNEWFSPEFCSTILMNLKKFIVQIEIHSRLHSKWMILNRVLLNYSDELKTIFYKFWSNANHMRSAQLEAEFCGVIEGELQEILRKWKHIQNHSKSE